MKYGLMVLLSQLIHLLPSSSMVCANIELTTKGLQIAVSLFAVNLNTLKKEQFQLDQR